MLAIIGSWSNNSNPFSPEAGEFVCLNALIFRSTCQIWIILFTIDSTIPKEGLGYITSHCDSWEPGKRKAKRKQRNSLCSWGQWAGCQGQPEPNVTKKVPSGTAASADHTIQPWGFLREVTAIVFLTDMYL